MAELKPCPVPWCRSVSIRVLRGQAVRWWLECQTCGCRSQRRDTEAAAIAEWNSRPQSDIERLAREVVPLWVKLAGSSVFAPIYEANHDALTKALDYLAAAIKEQDRGDAVVNPTCGSCKGSGKRSVNHKRNAAGDVLDYDVVACPDCDGSGLRVTIKEHDHA